MSTLFRFQETWKNLLMVVLLNLALSFSGLWVPYFNIDEVTNSLFGKMISQGNLGLSDFIGSPYLLTHYFYASLDWLFDSPSLLYIHLFHALWKSFTIGTIYLAGKEMAD